MARMIGETFQLLDIPWKTRNPSWTTKDLELTVKIQQNWKDTIHQLRKSPIFHVNKEEKPQIAIFARAENETLLSLAALGGKNIKVYSKITK